jgi:hypothetical protein
MGSRKIKFISAPNRWVFLSKKTEKMTIFETQKNPKKGGFSKKTRKMAIFAKKVDFGRISHYGGGPRFCRGDHTFQ